MIKRGSSKIAIFNRKASQPSFPLKQLKEDSSQLKKSIRIRKQTKTGNIRLFRLATRKRLFNSDIKNTAIMDMEIWVMYIQSLYFKSYVAKNYIGEINSTINFITGLLNITLFCIEINSASLLITTMLFVVDNMMGFSQYESAMALCLQLIDLCDYNSNCPAKMCIYIKMADICIKVRFFEFAVGLLQKTIEIAWIFENFGIELAVYDHLGFCYYLLNEMKYAKFYHEKYDASNQSIPRPDRADGLATAGLDSDDEFQGRYRGGRY